MDGHDAKNPLISAMYARIRTCIPLESSIVLHVPLW